MGVKGIWVFMGCFLCYYDNLNDTHIFTGIYIERESGLVCVKSRHHDYRMILTILQFFHTL